MEKVVCRSFSPSVDQNSSLLILGSMPGRKSLEMGQYYAHPKNRFWRAVFFALGEKLPGGYEQNMGALLERGVALWDVCKTCVRPGSLDKDIERPEPNDIPALLKEYGNIRTIAFNGMAAQRIFNTNFGKEGYGCEFLLLPSSSPVPRKKIRTDGDLLAVWREILGPYIGRP